MLNPKYEILNSKQSLNQNVPTSKPYDLEERTLVFAKKVRLFIKKLPRTIASIEDGKQLVRSSGSMGANYIEANESLSKLDFKMRIKISKKESKESIYWLKLIDAGNFTELGKERDSLIQEATELMKIFGSILERSK